MEPRESTILNAKFKIGDLFYVKSGDEELIGKISGFKDDSFVVYFKILWTNPRAACQHYTNIDYEHLIRTGIKLKSLQAGMVLYASNHKTEFK